MSQAGELFDYLSDTESLAIICHWNPDPDCIASALALETIAMEAGVVDVRILYSGALGHQQNRAFVNLLDIDLEAFDPADVVNREEESLLAFVDHAIPGQNNHVPEGTPVDIVIDHHPFETIDARFVDHREDVGATSTILTEYVQELNIEHGSPLATALLFAIRRETLGFLRGATHDEYTAAGTLHDYADHDLLRRLVNPSVSGATVDAIADAIENRTVRGSVLISHVGRTTERDALPQAADYLASLEGVETTVVFGIIDGTIQLSARSTDARIHIGDTLSTIFDDVGSAGGHREMAGGEIPLGLFADYADDRARLIDIVEEIITTRLVDGLNLRDESGNGAANGERGTSSNRT